MKRLTWWLRVVGVLYILNGVMMAAVRAPIRSAGPEGALDRAAEGEPLARFLVDTWVGFGLEVAAIGVVALAFSRRPPLAVGLAWSIIAIEFARGIVYDLYMVAQGYDPVVYFPWFIIHSGVIATGVSALRAARREDQRAG